MPGTTASGVPYALPEDPVSQWPATSRGVAEKVEASMPLGAIIAYGGPTAPAGWHLCDGTAHNSAALTALIGSATTPDLRGKFIVVAGSGYARGDTGGAASVTLTAAQSGLPAHTHTEAAVAAHSHNGITNNQNANHSHSGRTGDDSPDHAHQIAQYAQNMTGGTNNPYVFGATSDQIFGMLTSAGAGRHQHDFSTSVENAVHAHGIAADGGHAHTINPTTAANAAQAHENRPPYYALTYIIKKA